MQSAECLKAHFQIVSPCLEVYEICVSECFGLAHCQRMFGKGVGGLLNECLGASGV